MGRESARVEADAASRPGYAVIRITGAAAAASDARFRVTRPVHENGVLGPDGWQGAETLLDPLSTRAEGGDLLIEIGPAVVDRVEAGVYQLDVPAAGFAGVVSWPDLDLSREVGNGLPTISVARAAPTVGAATMPPSPSARAPVSSQSALQPSTPQPPPHLAPVATGTRTRSLWPFVALGLLCVVLFAGGAWWMLNHRRAFPVTVASSAPALPAPHTPPPAAPAPPTLPSAASPAPGPAAENCAAKTTINDIVTCAADMDTLYGIAAARWDNHQPGQGFLLLQIAADRGSGRAALRLAQIYDPDTFRPGGPIRSADGRQAAKYYRDAVRHGQDAAAAPRETLRQRLQRDSDNGDTLASLTLKDFWP